MKSKCRWYVIGAALTTILISCGYHFAGGGNFPAGVTRIFIPMLENRTAETGVERVFTNDLIYEFTRSRKDSLAKNRSDADGILTGVIAGLGVTNISRSSVSTATERRVIGTLNLQLESPEGRVFWKSGGIIEEEDYEVDSESKTATNQNKSEAIAELSRKMAQSAFTRLTDDF
jgi:outer membrane lipopolysaccharide assembly protein LptE/RlpB